MLTSIHSHSQITIPEAIILKLGLQEGDKLEISESGGKIQVTPVAVYPEEYLKQVQSEIDELKNDNSSASKVFYSLDDLMNDLNRP